MICNTAKDSKVDSNKSAITRINIQLQIHKIAAKGQSLIVLFDLAKKLSINLLEVEVHRRQILDSFHQLR